MEPTNHQFLSNDSRGVAPVPTQSAEISLEDETEALRNSTEWLTGIARKRLIQHPDFQMTLRRMKPNTRIPEHYNPGRICVQTLFGYIRMHADGRTFDLRRGQCQCSIAPSYMMWKQSRKALSCLLSHEATRP